MLREEEIDTRLDQQMIDKREIMQFKTGPVEFSDHASKYGDLDRQIGLLKSCECIKESEVRDLCNMARDILLEESNI